jgi:hypothetical protein
MQYGSKTQRQVSIYKNVSGTLRGKPYYVRLKKLKIF